MIALAALFVAIGLGVLSLGVHASRTAAASAGGEGVVDLVPQQPTGPGLAARAFAPLIDAGGRLMATLSPSARVELTRRRIVYAGLEGRRTVEQVLSQKALAAVAGGALGLVAHPSWMPALLGALCVGGLASFVPDVRLDGKARERQKQIARELPDALDLLSITVEAGLGLEQAIDIVADKLDGPLGDELRRLLREVELGVDRRSALALLRERTDVRELSSFVVALLQADQLGMAIGDVLRVQAHQVRLVRRQRAKELAAKTPVKILIPVVIGIFPSLFVVTIGPGAISIARAMFHS